jgi:4'-phosphopantetheinyl transferase EntD
MIDDDTHAELAARINKMFDALIAEVGVDVERHIANVRATLQQIIRGIEAERQRMLQELYLRRHGLHTERTRTQH